MGNAVVRDQLLLLGVVGFLSGVLFATFFPLPFALLSWGLVMSGGIYFALGVSGTRSVFRIASLVGAIFCLAVIIGGLRTEQVVSQLRNPVLDAVIGKTVALEAVVIREPEVRTDAVVADVSVRTMGSESTSGGGYLRLTLPAHIAVVYGDRVRVSDRLELPETFVAENGMTVDLPRILASKRVGYVMRADTVEVLAHNVANPIVGLLLTGKLIFSSAISRALPEPQSSLASGILLGERASLPEELVDHFIHAGIIHLVALSGYNMTVVAVFVFFLFRSLPRIPRVVLAIVAIGLFVTMTGFQSTAVRAAIMASLVLLAGVLGRQADAKRLLLVAVVCMVVWNPYALAFDRSFELSALATVGLLFVSPLVASLLFWITERFALREMIATTLATELTVLPLLLATSGVVSFAGLLANMLVLPIVPFAMLLSLLVGTVGVISALLAVPLGFLANLILSWIVVVGTVVGGSSFAAIEVEPVRWSMVFVMYAIGIAVVVWWSRLQKNKTT